MKSNPRQEAFELLLRFEKGGAARLKADSLIADALGKTGAEWPDADRHFFHALVMGVLRQWFRLGARIEHLTGRTLKQIAPPVRTLLRMGLFQLDGLDQVPAYAAINTTVELAKSRKVSPKTIKFINAVLREGQRRLEAGGFLPTDNDFLTKMLWEFGWPAGLTDLLRKHYDEPAILAMAEAAQTPAPLTLRVNTLTTKPDAYLGQLTDAGIQAEVLPDVPEGILLTGFSGSPRNLPGYDTGCFYVQDPASMWVGRLLAPEPDDAVLDLCAAPGSKTTHIAALMGNRGRIVAIDPKADRLQRLRENLTRLGVENTQCLEADGLKYEPQDGLFDRVLVDAPCSGSGTLRRHPEILLHLKKPNPETYTVQQAALLEKGFACLKPGGTLVYSTCSILQAENQDVVKKFLSQHKNAVLDFEEQRLISARSDGFYAARIRKPG